MLSPVWTNYHFQTASWITYNLCGIYIYCIYESLVLFIQAKRNIQVQYRRNKYFNQKYFNQQSIACDWRLIHSIGWRAMYGLMLLLEWMRHVVGLLNRPTGLYTPIHGRSKTTLHRLVAMRECTAMRHKVKTHRYIIEWCRSTTGEFEPCMHSAA